MIYLLLLIPVGLWLGYIWWDSRTVDFSASAQYDRAMRETDRRTHVEIDAAAEWQQSMEAHGKYRWIWMRW